MLPHWLDKALSHFLWSAILLTMQGKSSIPHSQELDSIWEKGGRVGTPIQCDLSLILEGLVLRSNPELSTIRNKDGMCPELNGSLIHENQSAS